VWWAKPTRSQKNGCGGGRGKYDTEKRRGEEGGGEEGRSRQGMGMVIKGERYMVAFAYHTHTHTHTIPNEPTIIDIDIDIA